MRLITIFILGGLCLSLTRAAGQSAPQFDFAWGQCCSGNGNFSDPQDIAFSSTGVVYVTDRNRVQLFSPAGDFISVWDVPSATAIDVDQQDNVFVASWTQIHKFSSSGVPLLTWGSSGSGNGQFAGIQGLAIAPNGTIYAADFGNYRVQQFQPDSSFIRTWGGYGTEDGNFVLPSGVAVDPIGNVYVSDGRLSWVQKFTETGQFLAKYILAGSPDHYVFDVEIGPQNEIFVVESGHDRIEVLNETGQLVSSWGTTGSGPGEFKSPMAIGISLGGGLYVVDYGNNRVEKFSYSVMVRSVSWGALKTLYAH